MLKTLLIMLLLFTAFSFGGTLIGVGVTAVVIIIMIFNMIPDIYALIGQRRYANGDIENGLKWLDRSYDTGRMDTHTAVYYAYILIKHAQIDKAQIVSNLMLGRNKIKENDEMMAKHNLSLIEYRRGNLDDAIELAQDIFEKAESTLLYGTLGYYKILRGDDDIYEFCKKAIDYNDDDSTILDNMLHVCIQSKLFDEAKEYADKLIAKEPKFVEAYYHCAEVYNALGDRIKALDAIEKTDGCIRTFMTTVTDEQIQQLKDIIK